MLRALRPDELDLAIAIDDDAVALFETVGLRFDLAPDHPFAQAEYARWAAAARAGLALVTEAEDALLVLGHVDGLAHLEQLSVRRASMRRGIGRALVAHAIAWAGAELWLTTYAHVPWNRPYYEGAGFAVVPDLACPPGIVAILAEQRRWLAAPGERIAMRRAT